MSLRIRFQYPTGHQLAYAIERLSDGLFYDFAPLADGTPPGFRPPASAGTLLSPLAERAAPFLGLYAATLADTPQATWTDGDYTVSVHDAGASNEVVAQLVSTMHSGDDATVFPTAAPAGYQVSFPGMAGFTLPITAH